MDLPSITSSAWEAIKPTLDPGVDLYQAKEAVFLQHVISGVFSFLRQYIPSGLSVSAAWKFHLCHRKYITQESRHNFDER